ncbi:AMP-binding protein [Burkholderia sp. AcTa6-5]|nr:AMP-binding protein [Burkholderia sp. AcTa6-5]
MFPDASTYGMLGIARMRTAPSIEPLRRAYRRLIERHEILRCRISDGASGLAAYPLAVERSDDGELLPLVEARDWSGACLAAFVDARFARAHEIDDTSLFRCVAVLASRAAADGLSADGLRTGASSDAREGETVGLLVFTAHHIVVDFLSFPLILRELDALYAEETAEPSRPPCAFRADANFRHLAAWERGWLGTEDALARAASYLARLDPPPEPLCFDGTPVAQPGARVEREHRFRLSAQMRDALLGCARAHGVTPYVAMLSVFQLLLHVHCATADVSVATPLHGRPRAFGRTIGYFANVLPVRQRIAAADTFADLLLRNRETLRSGLRLAPFPFATLCERAGVREMRPGMTALTQVALVWDAMPESDADAWLHIQHVEQRGTPYALALTVYARDDGWTCGLKHDPDTVPRHFVEQCLADLPRFAIMLTGAPTVPFGALAFVRPPDWHWPAPVAPEPPADFIEAALRSNALRTPDAIALRNAAQALSYDELLSVTHRMAVALGQLAPTSGPVGLLMERGVDAALALIAAFRAGIAVVPLHPDQPVAWLARACQDGGLICVVASAAHAELAASMPVPVLTFARWREVASRVTHDALPTPDPLDTAYVIYTSGSSGVPKGVVVARRSLQHLLAASRFMFDVADARWTLVHHPSFDFSMWELWGPLVHGRALTVLGEREAALPDAFHDALVRDGITHAGLTPAACRLLLPLLTRHGARTLRGICVGGAAVDAALATRLAALGIDTWTFYGPTEATVWAACTRLGASGQDARIGYPLAGMRAYVLDARLQWVPEHRTGELYLGGPQLTRYLGAPALTAAAFIPDPWQPGERMYRTGDRVRYSRVDGLVFVGRADRQVKVNGYRIELDALSNALSGCDGIAQAGCVHLPDQGVCALYTTSDGLPMPAERLAEMARRVLPRYVLPVRFVHRSAFALTRNGKADLDAMTAELARASRDAEPPADEAALCAEILLALEEDLGLPVVAADANFHDLGATSIVLANLHSRLAPRFATGFELADLYAFPTARRLAQWLASGARGAPALRARAPSRWQARRARVARRQPD